MLREVRKAKAWRRLRPGQSQDWGVEGMRAGRVGGSCELSTVNHA